MSGPQTILFDFDGTLIDSARSILAGLEGALAAVGVRPVVPLSPTLIGPPLTRTLATLAGSDDAELIGRLTAAFKEQYDAVGYRQTEVYPGVANMLEALVAGGIDLHIVTNKRIKPTRLILEHLDWLRHFRGIYALDALTPPATDKTVLVREVLQRESLEASSTWMVGDSVEDRRAAEANALKFFAATWGYGKLSTQGLTAPGELLQRLGGL